MSEIRLTKKELKKVFYRSYQALGCYTYDKQQGISYMRALLPALEKLYPDKEKLQEALNRHNAMFNTTCAFVPFCLGITCAMEEEYANAPKGSFDPQSINSVKIALMGPLAGIGDSFFWGTFRVIACGIGAPLAAKGNILGVILYLILNLLPSTLTRIYGFKIGYRGGRDFLAKIQADGTLDKITEAAKILGLVVIGGLIPSIVIVPVALELNLEGGSFILADVLDSIMPNLLPLVLSIIVYRYIQKGTSVNKLLFILLILGILLTAIGFFPMK
ncbi:PTS system mannose/fructose/sorbose family transporter subunit IID [Thomasclavelia sp.]|uniref:PTS system mannose/fructose/sorbose family transporter subunit IID n=1 Tax=Thomasclavelia sp. TaxID=3025757 RepID=UPI0025CD2D70|nr:PTS system mannose/fructose/sorbose family transporter subunit IID [Thomasclavelia sp.]